MNMKYNYEVMFDDTSIDVSKEVGLVTEEIAFEVFFGNNSYGFNLMPTDDNRIVFRKEFFGY